MGEATNHLKNQMHSPIRSQSEIMVLNCEIIKK